jgi:hypothetical protein
MRQPEPNRLFGLSGRNGLPAPNWLLREVRDARNNEHQVCARRRDGEPAVAKPSGRGMSPKALCLGVRRVPPCG